MQIAGEKLGKIALDMLMKKSALSSKELEERFAQAISPEYWRNLNPQLNVCRSPKPDEFKTMPDVAAQSDALLKKLAREGYFEMPPLVENAVLERMREGIENLRRAGWHELAAFVYDEFWQITRAPVLTEFLSKVLGENYKALPHVVVHYVRPETGAGWRPHVDFSDRADRFTVWVALSDATLDNGCMYVVPKNRVPDELLEKWMTTQPLEHREVCTLMHGSRALPVRAGGVLGWERDVIHWGTPSTPGAPPRISLSVVYLRENVEPKPDEIPLLSPTHLPNFAARMLAVGKAIDYYSIHDLSLNKYLELSKMLINEFREQAAEQSK